MLPFRTADSVPHYRAGDVVSACQFCDASAVCICLTSRQNYFVCQFRKGASFALNSVDNMPTLSNRIIDIVGLSTCPKVFWFNAWRVVTFVKNKVPSRNVSIGEEIRNPMGPSRFLVSSTGDTKDSIPTLSFSSGSSPCPAFARLINLRPETFNIPRQQVNHSGSLYGGV